MSGRNTRPRGEDPTPQERAESVFFAALERSPGERDVFVAERCRGDPDLERTVRELLAAHEGTGPLDRLAEQRTRWRVELFGADTVSSAGSSRAEGNARESTSPLAGTALGDYEVLGLLGRGGMGEVYRARHSTLGREVAIKTLPESVGHEPQRLERFAREAKLLASLNHPNVATLHGFEQHGDTPFLVMELVEGEDLAARLRRGPIPVEEAIPLFLQVTEGLEAAHASGIVHRDLKPANIKITPDARAKILDFGLAKASRQPGTVAEPSGAEQPTHEGQILGTAAYMSPEQARGADADARSDIWSFGCCLFEALTGRRAFEGETNPEVLGSVLQDEPDLEMLPDALAPGISRVIRNCLAKPPRDRWHHIADVRLELLELADEPSARPLVPPSRSRWAWGLGLAAVGGLVGVLLWPGFGASGLATPSDSLPYRVSIDAPLPGHDLQRWRPSVSISEDGRKLAVAGQGPGGGRIWVRDAISDRWRALPHSEAGIEPTLSSDGGYVSFRVPGKRVGAAALSRVRVSFDGGAPQSEPGGGWDEVDGWLLEAYDRCREETEQCPGILAYRAVEIGDAAIVCVLNVRIRAESTPRRLVVPTKRLFLWHRNGDPELLVEDACSPQRAGNRLLFSRGGELWAVSLTETGHTHGEAVPTGISPFSYSDVAPAHYDVSENGTLFYLDPFPDSHLWRFDARGGRLGRIPLDEPIPGSSPTLIRVSPDAKRVIVVSGAGRGVTATVRGPGPPQVRAVRIDTGEASRPVAGDSADWLNEAVFVVSETLGGRLELLDPNLRSLRTLPFERTDDEIYWSLLETVSPDGIAIVETGAFSRTGTGMLAVDLERPGGVSTWIDGPANERGARLSRDGRWVAWHENSTGRMEINASPWQQEPSAIPVTLEGGSNPRWSWDGKTLYFIDGNREWVMASDLTTDEEPAFSPPRRVFALPERTIHAHDVAYDTLPGDEFLFAIGEREMRHRLVFHWLTEVDERLEAANRETRR